MRYLNDPDLCSAIASMCRNAGARYVGQWSEQHPARWLPERVHNPKTSEPFSDHEAWEFVATLIETGHVLKIVELYSPPGTEGFELLVPVEQRDLYIKLALSKSGRRVIGRSFHYSDR